MNHFIRKAIFGISTTILLFACAGGEESSEEEPLRLGYIPSAEVEDMATTVEPLEEYLSEELGRPVTGEVISSYAGLVEAMANDQADLAFLPAFAFVQAEEQMEIDVLAKAIHDGSDSFVAQYVVRADSEIENVSELVNQEQLVWAFQDFNSTSGYLFPADHLMQLGADLDSQFEQLPSEEHEYAILQVLDGEADFATTFQDARTRLEQEIPSIYEEIRVIGTTDPIPNTTVSVRGELPEELKEEIQQAFLHISEEEDVLAVMQEVYTWEGFAEATAEDYDIVRSVYEEFEEYIE